MNKVEQDIYNMTMYKIACYYGDCEKVAGIMRSVRGVKPKMDPLRKWIDAAPSNWWSDFKDGVVNLANRNVDIVKKRKILPTDVKDGIKTIASPLTGYLAGSGPGLLGQFIGKPVENISRFIYKKIPKDSNRVGRAVKELAGRSTIGVKSLRQVSQTAPNNLIGSIPYTLSSAVALLPGT